MMAVERAYAVSAIGVGKPDYSKGIEESVEAVIMDKETIYSHVDSVNVASGDSEQAEVSVPSDNVVILHDFFASRPENQLLRLVVTVIDSAGNEDDIIDKYGYGLVNEHILKGHPALATIRFTLYNYGDNAVDITYGCKGFYTADTEYYIRLD